MPVQNNKYKIAQASDYVAEDWWKWWLYIDAAASDLDEIEYVIYTLHATFNEPVRKISDRTSYFRLDAEGWGVFTIYAQLHLKDGSTVSLEHDLHLTYPDGSENTE